MADGPAVRPRVPGNASPAAVDGTGESGVRQTVGDVEIGGRAREVGLARVARRGGEPGRGGAGGGGAAHAHGGPSKADALPGARERAGVVLGQVARMAVARASV